MSLRCRALLAGASLLVAGCGGTGAAPVPPPTPDAGPTVGAEPGPAGELQSCDNEESGFTVSFPGDWHANAGDGLPACSIFDPEPIRLPEAGEIPFDLAVVISRTDLSFEEATAEDLFEERISAEETTVDGRPALRVEARATSSGLAEEGLVSYRVYVAVDGETLIAHTYDVEETDHERNRRVLEQMLETIEIHDPG